MIVIRCDLLRDAAVPLCFRVEMVSTGAEEPFLLFSRLTDRLRTSTFASDACGDVEEQIDRLMCRAKEATETYVWGSFVARADVLVHAHYLT